MKIRSKTWTVGGLAVLAVVVVLFWLGRGASKPQTPTDVLLEKVTPTSLTETVRAPGTIEPKTKVSISARVSARIVELPFKQGQQVTGERDGKPGSLLVRLDATDLQAALRSTEARYAAQAAQIEVERSRIASQESQLQSTDASLVQAQRDLDRQTQLIATGDVSQSAVDDAQTAFDRLTAEKAAAQQSLDASRKNLVVLEHTLEASEADVARARDNLSYAQMFSPIDGVVTKVNAEVGELVMTGTMNNAGTVILEVADLSTMLVAAEVNENDIPNVKVGQRAKAHLLAYPDQEFSGVVRTIGLVQTTYGSNEYYKVEVELDHDDRPIFTDMGADVEILTNEHHDVLTVPSQSVLGASVDSLPSDIRSSPLVEAKKTITPVVYRHVDGKALATPVKIGPSDATRTIILQGLNDGDEVVTGPYKVLEKLKHDQPIRKQEGPTPGSTATQKSDEDPQADHHPPPPPPM
ncbi:MAG: efflux RND transporter periplasmic adaptor subunit [Phycisphaeraceae bacterium]|nr:efflux RND transporter periplasmic adaptor subunit [Phycisphaeraceae bacterium]